MWRKAWRAYDFLFSAVCFVIGVVLLIEWSGAPTKIHLIAIGLVLGGAWFLRDAWRSRRSG